VVTTQWLKNHHFLEDDDYKIVTFFRKSSWVTPSFAVPGETNLGDATAVKKCKNHADFKKREIHGELMAPIHGHVVFKKHRRDEHFSLRK